MPTDRDYVLGTHDEELARLGLQHRVWRPVVLDCWQRAGITVGKRVLDVGAGPGYATVDLAEIVGPTGEIVALERSRNFVRAMKATCRARSLTNVKIHEIDLMSDDLPAGDYDFAWCRWVVSFVNDPPLLIRKLARVMPKASSCVFHEYGALRDLEILPAIANARAFPRARHCDLAQIWGRTRSRGKVAGVAGGQRFCDSLSATTHFLPATKRLYVAMAGHVHRNLSPASY